MTPDVREALSWFWRTHEVTALVPGVLRWRQERLPYSGGFDRQEVWLLSALAHLRAVANAMLLERSPDDEASARRVHEQIRKEE